MACRIFIALVVCAFVLGCKTTKPSNGGDGPIVSPTNISDEKQDKDAPNFPYFIPWWAK